MKKTLNKIIEDNFYNKFVYDSKKQLLDPLCSMCRIIELYFRPIGSKFGINDHSITIDMPTENNNNWYNITNYQSYQRYWNADSRENISKLGDDVCGNGNSDDLAGGGVSNLIGDILQSIIFIFLLAFIGDGDGDRDSLDDDDRLTLGKLILN